jgi:hypothetical protein
MRMLPATEFCSERFTRTCSLLEGRLKFNEKRLQDRLRQLRSDTESADKFRVERIEKRLRLKYTAGDGPAIYVLSKVGSSLVTEFLQAAESEDFWTEAYEYYYDNPHVLWFLYHLGIRNEHMFKMIDNMVKEQTVEGHIPSNQFDHSGALRVLVAVQPESKALASALDYWADNWNQTDEPGSVALAVLALSELDAERYSPDMAEQIAYLKHAQGSDGSWGYPSIEQTSYAIWAIARVNGVEDSDARRALEWVVKQPLKERTDGLLRDLPEILLALLAMGEGPKVSCEVVDNHMRELEQKIRTQKALFVHTSPNYRGSLHVKEIHDRAIDMLRKARAEIRIASPFIDMLYEEVIDLKKERPELVIKIITRPKAAIQKGQLSRQKIARNAIDLLNTATKGGIVQSELLHARMMIIDDTEALISSADLTRDQLFDEFNAGVWASDKEVVAKAVEFFENVCIIERQKAENTNPKDQN